MSAEIWCAAHSDIMPFYSCGLHQTDRRGPFGIEGKVEGEEGRQGDALARAGWEQLSPSDFPDTSFPQGQGV